MPKRSGRKSASQTPAPLKDRIRGSKVNPEGSASSEKSASAIKLNAKTLVAISNKLKEFKEKHPNKKNISLADLKAVYRRGSGAYSSTHRPTISGGKPNTRNAWSMARVNKFLLKAGGTKVKKAYVQDDDLMKYANGGEVNENNETYKKWRSLVNMSYSELKRFYESKEGKEAGLSSSEAKKQGIDSGRESARMIMKMKTTPKSEWTPDMWRWAKKQISFISRMSGNKGSLYDDKGRKTRKHTSLLIWGHNPEKMQNGGETDVLMEDTVQRMDDPNFADPSYYKKGGETDMEFNDPIIYHEENGNFFIPKNTIYYWLYDDKDAGKKLNSGEYDFVLFPPATLGMASQKGFVPPLQVIWTKKYQKNTKGSERLIGIIQAYLDEKKNKLYIEMMTTKPSLRGKGIMSYMVKQLRQDFDLSQEDVVFVNKTKEGERFDSAKHYEQGGYIAPNGSPSKLTPEQYKLVRTPEFKAWFGDWEKLAIAKMKDPAMDEITLENLSKDVSKVVDENGEPLVLWHYSKRLQHKSERFSVFNVNKQLGSHFGTLSQAQNIKYVPKPVEANILGLKVGEPIYPTKDTSDFRYFQVFLNIKNPLRLKDEGIFEVTTLTEKILYSKEDYDFMSNRGDKSFYDRAKELAKNKGIDGVVYLNRYESDATSQYILSLDDVSDEKFKQIIPSAEDSWIAFYPEQIKLADGTNTKFDANNPDIRYEDGGMVAPNGQPSYLSPELYQLVRTPEFKSWFGDWENDPKNASKVVNENGEPLICFHGTNEDFNTFDDRYWGSKNDYGFYGAGFYFTFQKNVKYFNASIGEAKYYGKRIIPCFIKAKNPFIFSRLSEYKGKEINYVGYESIAFLSNLVQMFPSLGDDIKLASNIFNPKTRSYDHGEVSISILPALIDKYAKELKLYVTENQWGERNVKSGYVKSELIEYDYTQSGGGKGSYIEKDSLGNWEFSIKDGVQYPSDEEISFGLICEAIKKYEGIEALYHPEGYMTRYRKITELIKQNHDCIMQGEFGDELVVFEPNQIKLADGTNTTFDVGNLDIRFDYGGELKKLGLTESEVSEWEKQNKVSQRQVQNPNVLESAQKLSRGEISQDEYIKSVKEFLPIKPFTQVPQIPTLLEIVGSLKENQIETGIIGYTKFIPDGELVATRLDIPAYNNYDVWIVSVHDGLKEGKSIGYGQTAYLKNVTFVTSPKVALNIATNRSDKTTFARMKGEWINKDPREVRNMAIRNMDNKSWVQVGMNPYRHSWFYDKSDGMPLLSAEELVQVGALVLAKNPVKTTPDNPVFAVSKDNPDIRFAKGGSLFKSHKTIEQIAKEKNVPLSHAKNQLKQGMEVESEHSDSVKIQKTIALQHLDEDINYYKKLKTIEN